MTYPDKTVETYLVQLQAVSSVNVQSYSRSMASQSSRWKLQFSPDTYLIQIKTTKAISGHSQSYKKGKLKSTENLPNDHEADIQFADEQTATRVADAIRHAAGLCGATQRCASEERTYRRRSRVVMKWGDERTAQRMGEFSSGAAVQKRSNWSKHSSPAVWGDGSFA